MYDYKKLNSFVTILTSKHDFLNSYFKEIYRSNRYDYSISSLNIVVPKNISSKIIIKIIRDSFRDSDIVYYNQKSHYMRVLLPYTPQEHLDIIIDRVNKIFNSNNEVNANEQLICTKIKLIKDSDTNINSIFSSIEQADENATLKTHFEKIFNKLLTIIENKDTTLSFVNYYCGMKVNYKASFIKSHDGLYTFETNSMQLAAIYKNSSTIIQIKKYGYDISAKIETVDYITNTITLKDLCIMTYNNIYPTSLTVELKSPLNAKLISLGGMADIKVSAISFNEIYACGDISALAINENTMRFSITKDNTKHSLRVKFISSEFDGERQNFTLRIIDDSQTSIDLFQSLVTQRSRECIQELRRLTA